MCLPFILTLPGSPFSPFSPSCPAEPGVPLSLTKKRVVSYLQQRLKVGIEGTIRSPSLAWFPQKRPIKVTKRMHWSLLMVKKRSVNGTWSLQADSAACTEVQLCWFCINWCLVRREEATQGNDFSESSCWELPFCLITPISDSFWILTLC